MAHVKILPNDHGNPPGKVAEAELHFEDGDGVLAGTKLVGFGIWERRGGGTEDNRYNVTFPARQYSINGERRSFALLRPIGDDPGKVRTFIVDAFLAHQKTAVANG